MLDSFLETLAVIDSFLWGPWTMGFLAGVAIYFTVRSGFFQITGLGYILRTTLGRLTSSGSASAKEDQAMTPVQAAVHEQIQLPGRTSERRGLPTQGVVSHSQFRQLFQQAPGWAR